MSDTQAAPVRLGVIGAGWFASRRHLPDADQAENVEIAALCRRDPAALAKVADRFRVPSEARFADWQEMLDKAELDAVLIATPHDQHHEQAKAALEQGLHVLVEKPMTVRADHARELVALAAEKNLTLAVALNPPHWAHCHRIRRALAKPEMAELESVSLYWTGSAEYVFGRAPQPDNLPGVVPPTLYRADPAQNGGGYLMDGGPHLVSTLLWCTGRRARRVTALTDALPSDMRFALAIELEGGAVATITGVGDSHYSQRRVRNTFGASGGTITVNGYHFDTLIHVLGQEDQRFKEEDLFTVSGPVANFANAIQGREKLFSPGEHGARVTEVLEAAYVSAAESCVVTLDA